MIRIISALILALAATLCNAEEQPLQLANNAPERHVVVPGDTLWGIAGKFLKEPWRWPEVWGMNREDIKNPNRIFPGEVIVLGYDANGKPRLSKQDVKLQPQIYSEQLTQSIPSISTNLISPFLSAPLIIDADGLEKAARIVATQQDRVYLGNNDLAYVTNADPSVERWQVYRNGKAKLDPDTSEVLGYEAFFLGTAQQTEPGDPAVFRIITAKEEVGSGDRLIPAMPPILRNHVPHKPEQAINGQIISVYGGVNTAGQYSIILLNQGTRDGIEIGHVLSLQRNRAIIQRNEDGLKENVKIPDERYGLALVFRTFERLSYALVMQSEGSVVVGDHLRTP